MRHLSGLTISRLKRGAKPTESERGLPRAAADVMVSAVIIEAEQALQFDTIDDVISDVARGRIVIVTDDADRENEGDLVTAAEKATPDAFNFMATHGRGLICVPIANERA